MKALMEKKKETTWNSYYMEFCDSLSLFPYLNVMFFLLCKKISSPFIWSNKFLFIEYMLYISEPIFNFFEDHGH
jgi:hypothetical protein